MQRTDDPQVKVTIIKVASIALIVAILAWSLPLDSIHSDTFFIGGRWFDTLIWITRGLSVFGGMFTIAVIADKGSNSFNKFLKGREQVINARLKNKKLTQELDLTPKIIGAGLERGFSVEYDKLKVYSPIERMHESYRYDQPKDEPNSLPPETYNLSDALSDYEPSEKGIILGKSSKGLITLPLGDQICHIAEASKTGSGKTQLNRSIAAQLIYAGQHVYFIDPFFREVRMNYSTGQKFDYRPFVPKLAGLGSSVDSCVNILKGAYEEVQRRQRL